MEISKTIVKTWPILIGVGLIIFAVAWRLSSHLPNFAPIGAISLVAGMVLGWRKALWITLPIIIISDLILGFYSSIEWTWLSFILIVALGWMIRNLPVVWRVIGGALGTSVLFFAVSNFGTWLTSGMYSHDISDLLQCYVMALPFFKATLVSDLVFVSALIGAYEGSKALLTKGLYTRRLNRGSCKVEAFCE